MTTSTKFSNLANYEGDAVVTLWGDFAESFDADTLRSWSKREPVLVLFVGVMVDQYAGSMAFKKP